MSGNQEALDALKSASTEALETELKRRVELAEREHNDGRESARAAFEEFLQKEWLFRLVRSVYFFAIKAALALLMASLAGYMFAGFTHQWLGAFTGLASFVLLAAAISLVLAPTMWSIHKERRLREQFKKEHPEHAEML